MPGGHSFDQYSVYGDFEPGALHDFAGFDLHGVGFSVSLFDDTGLALSSTDLPLDAPSLADFARREFSLDMISDTEHHEVWVRGEVTSLLLSEPDCCDPCELAHLLVPLLPGAPGVTSTNPCFDVPVPDPPTEACCEMLEVLLPGLPGSPSLATTHPCLLPPCVPVPAPDCVCDTLFDPVECDQGVFENQCFADCECATNCEAAVGGGSGARAPRVRRLQR